MAPVVVTTGGADSRTPATTTARVAAAGPGPAKTVPVPRLRPAPSAAPEAASPPVFSLDD